MPTRQPFSVDEWYHCYNRGVDKRRVFINAADYKRFVLLMYLCNSQEIVHVQGLYTKTLADVVNNTRPPPLVSIGAYCLMPNHIHLAMLEKTEGGISRFMQKLMTGYTMYFNKKHERTGSLFAGTFKSKHVLNERYLKHLVSYIHLNPAELYDPKWKSGTASINKIRDGLATFRYSSLADYQEIERPENVLLGPELRSLYDHMPTIAHMMRDAQAYYESTTIEV